MGGKPSKSGGSSLRLWSFRRDSSSDSNNGREKLPAASSHRVNGFTEGSGDASSSNGTNNPIAVQMKSYEKTYKEIPEIQSLDDALRLRAQETISAIAADANKSTISLASLGKATDYVFDTEEDAVRRILESNEDICRNPDLKALVDDYLDSSAATLKFCSHLKKCVMNARNKQLMSIKLAVMRFEEEEEEGSNINSQEGFRKTLEALSLFKELGQPFSEEFFQLFRSVHDQQKEMLVKLTARRSSLGKKLKKIKSWRRVSGIIFASTFAVALVCSVVAAALTAPPAVIALASAATTAFGPLGSWFRSLWKNYEGPHRNVLSIVSDMEEGTKTAIEELTSIEKLVDRLTADVQALQGQVDFALRYDDAIRIAIKDIREKLNEFEDWLKMLENRAEICARNVREARTAVCKKKLSVQ